MSTSSNSATQSEPKTTECKCEIRKCDLCNCKKCNCDPCQCNPCECANSHCEKSHCCKKVKKCDKGGCYDSGLCSLGLAVILGVSLGLTMHYLKAN